LRRYSPFSRICFFSESSLLYFSLPRHTVDFFDRKRYLRSHLQISVGLECFLIY
jgi:hypothetical protein